MIKTLRITIIVTAIVAGVFFVLSGMFGLRRDKDKEAFLSVPSVTTAFKNGTDSRNISEQDIPLIRQAQALALRINPPPPPKPIASTMPIVPVKETAKFTLVGTSYLAEDPNKSMALINEPGKGTHWVMKSDNVDRFTITQIVDGKITYTDGQKIEEMVTEKPAITNAITVISVEGGPAPPGVMKEVKQPVAAPSAVQDVNKQSIAAPSIAQPTAAELKENAEFIKKLMNDPNSVGVGKTEANDLKGLGEFLKQVEQEQAAAEANQAKAESNDSNKVKKTARPGR